jgi:hypothetical protein
MQRSGCGRYQSAGRWPGPTQGPQPVERVEMQAQSHVRNKDCEEEASGCTSPGITSMAGHWLYTHIVQPCWGVQMVTWQGSQLAHSHPTLVHPSPHTHPIPAPTLSRRKYLVSLRSLTSSGSKLTPRVPWGVTASRGWFSFSSEVAATRSHQADTWETRAQVHVDQDGK